jgi:hypothetical protein
MDDRRRVDELASRCVALVIFHRHDRKIRPARVEIASEIRAVAAEAIREGLSWAGISAEVLRELEARYDPTTARRLHVEFIAGLDESPPVGLV